MTQTYEERQAKLDALKKAREKQKEANGNTPKYHETENRVIDLPQKTIITKVEYIKEVEVEYVPVPSKSWGTSIYENIIPIGLTIGGVLTLGYFFKNEISIFFAGNRYNGPSSPLQDSIIRARIDNITPQKLAFDSDLDQVLGSLKDHGISLETREINRFREDFLTLMQQGQTKLNEVLNNLNNAETIKDRAEFDKIFSDQQLPSYIKIEKVNIKQGIVKKVLALPHKNNGAGHNHKDQMYNFFNREENKNYKFLVYLMLKMVHGKKIEDLNQADNNDAQTLDMHLTDYELSANEEVRQAETCPNVDIYSKKAMLLDPQELPTWEMLGEEAICVHTLTDKQEEVVSNAQIVDNIEDFIIEITPSSLVEKAVLAYEPGTCSTIMGSLNMFVQTSGLQYLIDGVINSGANPYIALVNSIAIPLAQNMLISQTCNKVEQLFEEQTFSIAEKMVNKLLEKQLLLGIEDKSSDQEAYADETLDTTIPEMHFFVQENNSCPNTALNSFNVFEQPDITQGEHYTPIEVVSAGSFFD